jgi:hypothetical protein
MPANPGTPPKPADFDRDLKAFEQLPAKTQELDLLKDRAEKATGLESVALNRLIVEKAR